MITHKICKTCGKKLKVSSFTKSKNVKDGYENKCKICRQEARKKYLNTCETCGAKWKTSYKNTKYCSPACKPQSKKDRKILKCSFCGKDIERTKSQIGRCNNNYCSEECKNKGYSQLYSGENSTHYNRKSVKCSFCNKEILRTEYEIKKYRYLYCSDNCKIQHYKILFSGENNPNFNPNKDELDRIRNRNIDGYQEWIRKVFEKDNYTCQCCKDSRGGNLNAHHIFNYSEYKELRTNTKNGITLCKICHKKFHDIYGYSKNNDKQLEEFLNRYQKSTY